MPTEPVPRGDASAGRGRVSECFELSILILDLRHSLVSVLSVRWLAPPQSRRPGVWGGRSGFSSLRSAFSMPRARQLLLLTLLHTVAGSRLPAGAPLELASLPVGEEATGERRGHKFVARRLSEKPHAFLLKNWLSQDECDALMKAAESNGLDTAETSGVTDARRHCDVAVLSPWEHDTVKSIQVDAARMLLSEEAMSLPGGGCEDLHVLRYQPGGVYKPN